MGDDRMKWLYIGLLLYIIGAVVAGAIMLHPDWRKPLQEKYGMKAGNVAEIYVVLSWYTVLRMQRKWIIREIKHRWKLWNGR